MLQVLPSDSRDAQICSLETVERKAKRWLEVPQSLAGCCEFIQHRIQPYYKFWRVLGANMSKWWVS